MSQHKQLRGGIRLCSTSKRDPSNGFLNFWKTVNKRLLCKVFYFTFSDLSSSNMLIKLLHFRIQNLENSKASPARMTEPGKYFQIHFHQMSKSYNGSRLLIMATISMSFIRESASNLTTIYEAQVKFMNQ